MAVPVNVPVTQINRTPVTVPAATTGDPVNGHTVANSGRVWLEITNTDAGATHTVTVAIAQTVDGQSVTPKTYTVPASATQKVLLGDPEVYGNTTGFTVNSNQLTFRAFTV